MLSGDVDTEGQTRNQKGNHMSEPEITLLKIKGKKTNFTCDCGCKLFTVVSPKEYRCQDCESLYEAEKVG